MTKRILLFLLFLVIVLIPAFSTVEFWMGLGATTAFDFLTHDFLNRLNSDEVEIQDYKGEKVEYIDLIGPFFEMSLFPYKEVPLSIDLSGSISFVIGIQGNSYISRHLDFRLNVKSGLSYTFMINDTSGLFVSTAYFLSWTRIATTNKRNDKGPVTFVKNLDMGVSLGVGVVTRFKHSYFRFGLSSDKVIQLGNDNSGLSVDLFVGGGYIF